MSQEVLNSSENINIAHGVSLWFQESYSGNYIELGDCLVNEVTLSPEFSEFRSYRNGRNVLRKRLLTATAAQITAALNEPNIINLKRVIFGGTLETSQAATVYEGRHLTVRSDSGGTYVDLKDDASEDDFLADITVTGIYPKTDVQESTATTPTNATPDTNGHVYFLETDIAAGDTVYVKYTIAYSGLFKSEIFGATDAMIEGAAQLQARNMKGGIVQLWELASVNLAPNGGLTFPLNEVQTVPILMSLQERGGSYGHIYVK